MYWKSDQMFVCKLEDKDIPALGISAEKVSGCGATGAAAACSRGPGCCDRAGGKGGDRHQAPPRHCGPGLPPEARRGEARSRGRGQTRPPPARGLSTRLDSPPGRNEAQLSEPRDRPRPGLGL